MNKRVYGAFTLIEMLVVMGILIILMVIGISAGRFALFRAGDVAHRNGADQLYEGLQAYFVDNRAYPQIDSCEGVCNPAKLMLEEDKLSYYMDRGSFNGGSGATYLYFTGGDNNDQAALICVSMRGTKDVNDTHTEGAYYCSGNAFKVQLQTGAGVFGAGKVIDQNLIEVTNPADAALWQAFVDLGNSPANGSNWDGQVWVEEEVPPEAG